MVNAADSLRSDTSLLVDPNLEFSFLKFHRFYSANEEQLPPPLQSLLSGGPVWEILDPPLIQKLFDQYRLRLDWDNL